MNATQRALLKAIAANPHDDTPRLVYADWLDEHAAELPKKERDATAARAEIIRVQCELARLAEEDCDSRWVYEYMDSQGLYSLDNAVYRVDWSALDTGVARRVELRAREHQLTAQFREEWRKAEVPKIDDVSFDLRRGFWTLLTLSGEKRNLREVTRTLLKHPDFIPPEVLSCQRLLTAQEAKQLVSSGLTDHLTAVWDVNWEEPTLFVALGETKAAAGIREVSPASCPRDYLIPFAKSKKWRGIRTIRVIAHGDHRIPSLQKLARCKHLAEVQSLVFNDDASVGFWCVKSVANGVWKNLRRLDWEAFGMGGHDVDDLARGTALKRLRYLRLGREVDGVNASAMFTSSVLKNLVILDLNHNLIRGLDAPALRKATRLNLRVLNFSSANRMSLTGKRGLAKEGLVALANSPATHNLQILDLSNNGLTDSAMKPFFRAMQIPQLAWLSLWHNEKLGPATAEAIATCDRLTNLQALNLMWTKIGNAGAKALAKSKHLGKLRHLDVSQAGVTASGLAALRKRFGEDVVRG